MTLVLKQFDLVQMRVSGKLIIYRLLVIPLLDLIPWMFVQLASPTVSSLSHSYLFTLLQR